MSSERYADEARRWIRRLRPESSPRLPADRQRLVGAVQEALRTRRRRRTMVRMGAGLTAIAAALVLLARLDLVRAPWQHVVRSGGAAIASAEKPGVDPRTLTVLGRDGKMTVTAGVELVAPSTGNVQIGTAEGTLLTLEPGGELAVTESTKTQRFALLRGAVQARVAKLHPGERFIINSTDAEIEVHGTQFRVALAAPDPGCLNQPATRVSVTEGVVSVRSGGQEVRVHPGEHWPSAGLGCVPVPRPELPTASRPGRSVHARLSHAARLHGAAAKAVAAAPAEAPVPVVALAASSDQSVPASPRAPALAAPTPVRTLSLPPPSEPEPDSQATAVAPKQKSELAAQNDLFAAAVRAKRSGRDVDAIRYLTRLVRRYPNGPLAESAMAQRMKLLAASDPVAGVDAAAEYLARFPGGFARADAEVITRGAAKRP
jgi:FecR protein